MFEHLGKALKERVKHYRFSQEIREEEVLSAWNDLMEKKFGPKKVRAFSFKGKVLKVKVLNPVLSQELRLLEDEIKKKIESKEKGVKIEKIFYQVGKIKDQAG